MLTDKPAARSPELPWSTAAAVRQSTSWGWCRVGAGLGLGATVDAASKGEQQ